MQQKQATEPANSSIREQMRSALDRLHSKALEVSNFRLFHWSSWMMAVCTIKSMMYIFALQTPSASLLVLLLNP
jgi:hypothetical protein